MPQPKEHLVFKEVNIYVVLMGLSSFICVGLRVLARLVI